jgi:hypothetical protein
MKWYTGGAEIQLQSIWISAIDGSGELYVFAVLPQERTPSVNSIRGWVGGHQRRFGRFEKKINPSTEFRTLGLLARNLSQLPHGDRWECNIKMDHKGAECHVLTWIHLAQDSFQWWHALNTLMDSGGLRFVVPLAVYVENQVFWNVTLCHLASISLTFRRIVANAPSSARSMTRTFFFGLPDPEYEGTMTSRHVKSYVRNDPESHPWRLESSNCVFHRRRVIGQLSVLRTSYIKLVRCSCQLYQLKSSW